MGITAKTTQSNFELVPSGSHIARCYSMVEIGTVTENYKGELKTLHKVRITWELPLETKVFNPEKGEQPFSVSKEYTLSMHEKSNLRKDLSSWRGRGFTEEEASAFDITKLLGVPCMVNVVHNTAQNGNTYANVLAISPLPKGTQCPPQINGTFMFSFENFEQSKFDSLPDWLKDRIKATPEYNALFVPKDVKAETYGKLPSTDLGDDLPF
jgi:hypothetical protein